jgi:hypothetical protein
MIKSPGQSLKRSISIPPNGILNRPDRFFNFGVLLGSSMTDVFYCLQKPWVLIGKDIHA